MNCKVCFVLVFSVFCNGANTAADEASCPPVPKHYAELDCKPVMGEGNKCPSRFDCPEITDLDGNKCYYEGQAYNKSAEISTETTSPLCAAACRCDDRSTPASFNCANIECPHHFQPYRPDCKQIYKSNTCCPSETVCDKVAIEKLDLCYFESKEYRVGEKMYPSVGEHSCYTCQCAENFDNSTVIGNANCQEINCGIQLRNFGRVRSGCVPLYYGTARCCPIGWRCPKDQDDTVIPSSRSVPENIDSKMTCKFGDKIMNIGDELKTDNKCTTCTCVLPPMPYCVQKTQC